MAKQTIKAAMYLRISLDATGEQLAITRQRKDCRKIAADRGWEIIGEYVDNSISASDKGTARPGYNRMVAAFEAGEFDALICYDLDRLTRQPRQLEDWIDAAEERGLLLVTANGEADLSTDGGRLFARIKASVARAEVERKGQRQKRAALQRAEDGAVPKGVRLAGYTTGGSLVTDEAKIIREIFERFMAGDSLRGICAWLAENEIPTRSGRPWNPSSVRTLLTNPRYAGRSVYNRKANGTGQTWHAGTWTPIVDEATFDVVQAKLTDPRRRSQVGTDRKYLGAGLYLCGVCDAPLRSHSGGRYRCPAGGHITRIAASIDDLVLDALRARLGKPDLADVLAAPDGPQASKLATEVTRLRGRLVKIESDYDAELIDGRRFKIATAKVIAELATVEAAQIRALADAGVAATLTAADPVAHFDAAPLMVQRGVLAFFLIVRLDPAERGRKFVPATVRFDWRQGEHAA